MASANVYTWGLLQEPRASASASTQALLRPQLVDTIPGESIVDLAAGNLISAALTEAGHVYTWGSGRYYALGHGNELDLTVPTRVHSLTVRARRIACGWSHMVAIDVSGSVHSWGCAETSRLGHPGTDGLPRRVIFQPVKQKGEVVHAGRMRDVACGARHTLALDDAGRIWSWGCNKHMQVGGIAMAECLAPVLQKRVGRAAAISAGEWFSVALLVTGEVFVWGRFVSPGHGAPIDHSVPMCIPFSQPVNLIACGAGHIVAAHASRDRSRIWLIGNADEGQCGAAETRLATRPIALPYVPGRIAKLAAGAAHNIVLTETGGVYTMGSGQHGQLGDGTRRLRPRLRQVAALAGVHIQHIAAGDWHCAALTGFSLGSSFGAALLTDDFSDISVSVFTEDGTVHRQSAHRCILAARSRGLARMLGVSYTPGKLEPPMPTATPGAGQGAGPGDGIAGDAVHRIARRNQTAYAASTRNTAAGQRKGKGTAASIDFGGVNAQRGRLARKYDPAHDPFEFDDDEDDNNDDDYDDYEEGDDRDGDDVEYDGFYDERGFWHQIIRPRTNNVPEVRDIDDDNDDDDNYDHVDDHDHRDGSNHDGSNHDSGDDAAWQIVEHPSDVANVALDSATHAARANSDAEYPLLVRDPATGALDVVLHPATPPRTLRILLDYLYTDTLTIDRACVEAPWLYQLAHQLELPHLAAQLTSLQPDIDACLPTGTTVALRMSSSYVSDLVGLANNADLADVCFRVEDDDVTPPEMVVIAAHKVVLAARCPYFAAMLSAGLRETLDDSPIYLPSMSAAAMRALFLYLYTDEIRVTPSLAVEMLGVAHQCTLDPLLRAMEGFLQSYLEVDTVAYVFHAADLYSAMYLRGLCLTYILRHHAAVYQTGAYRDLPPHLIREIVECRKANQIEIVKFQPGATILDAAGGIEAQGGAPKLYRPRQPGTDDILD